MRYDVTSFNHFINYRTEVNILDDGIFLSRVAKRIADELYANSQFDSLDVSSHHHIHYAAYAPGGTTMRIYWRQNPINCIFGD